MSKTTAASALALLALAALAQAQAPPQAWTKVTLEDIHCGGCAKKVSAKVTAVPGVAEMRVDVKAKAIWAVHKQGMTPSPKALWEGVEAADPKRTGRGRPSGRST